MPASTHPEPHHVTTADGTRIAAYDVGEPQHPPVIALHGFASSATANWGITGWRRDLTRAGLRLIAVDLRGHGNSDKPHDPSRYTMPSFIADLRGVIDHYRLDRVAILGYSLGARVGWRAAIEMPDLIERAVLGGLPAGDPLARFRLDQAREFLRTGRPVEDRLTAAYVGMAATLPGNDPEALISLVDGMRGELQADATDVPLQPLLLATGGDDPIIAGSRLLAEAAPRAEFLEVPGRSHFNAPTSGRFRAAAVEFLTRAGR